VAEQFSQDDAHVGRLLLEAAVFVPIFFWPTVTTTEPGTP
jgi:hypothetical protein